MSTYIDGVTQIPKPIDDKLIKKQRELEQKQRALEKKVRRLKRLEAGTQSPETAKAYRKELREAQHELKMFVDEHNDVLRRDYSREKYYGESVDKLVKPDIIELTTSNGIDVTQFSQHMKERAVGRNVSIDEIKDALTNPLHTSEIKIDSLGRPSQRFIGEKATVNINPDTGTVTTIWKTGTSNVKKYKKE